MLLIVHLLLGFRRLREADYYRDYNEYVASLAALK